jgi:hypothetical protein
MTWQIALANAKRLLGVQITLFCTPHQAKAHEPPRRPSALGSIFGGCGREHGRRRDRLCAGDLPQQRGDQRRITGHDKRNQRQDGNTPSGHNP